MSTLNDGLGRLRIFLTLLVAGIVISFSANSGFSADPTEWEVAPDPIVRNEAKKYKIAAVDGTITEDAKAAHDGMVNVHAWVSAGLFCKAEGNEAQGTGDKCKDLGKIANMLWISGHGFGVKAEIYGEEGFGLKGQPFTPAVIGNAWNDNAVLDWVVFAACNQARIQTTWEPTKDDNAIRWIKKMPVVHSLSGYRGAAPVDPTDSNVANQFVADLKEYSVVNAWLHANYAKGGIYWPNGRSIINVNNTINNMKNDDKLWDKNHVLTKDKKGNIYVYRKAKKFVKPGGAVTFGVSQWSLDLTTIPQ